MSGRPLHGERDRARPIGVTKYHCDCLLGTTQVSRIHNYRACHLAPSAGLVRNAITGRIDEVLRQAFDRAQRAPIELAHGDDHIGLEAVDLASAR